MSKSSIEKIIVEMLSDEQNLMKFLAWENQNEFYIYHLNKNIMYTGKEFDEFTKEIKKSDKGINQNSLNESDSGTKNGIGKKTGRAFKKVLAAGLVIFLTVPVVQNLIPQAEAINISKTVESKKSDTSIGKSKSRCNGEKNINLESGTKSKKSGFNVTEKVLGTVLITLLTVNVIKVLFETTNNNKTVIVPSNDEIANVLPGEDKTANLSLKKTTNIANVLSGEDKTANLSLKKTTNVDLALKFKFAGSTHWAWPKKKSKICAGTTNTKANFKKGFKDSINGNLKSNTEYGDLISNTNDEKSNILIYCKEVNGKKFDFSITGPNIFDNNSPLTFLPTSKIILERTCELLIDKCKDIIEQAINGIDVLKNFNLKIMIKGHSRGAVIATAFVKKIKDLLQGENVKYSNKLDITIDRILLDPVPGGSKCTQNSLDKNFKEDNIDEELGNMAGSKAVVYSLVGRKSPINSQFTPQQISGANVIILTDEEHEEIVDKNKMVGYHHFGSVTRNVRYVFDGKGYSLGKLHMLPEGVYEAGIGFELKKLNNFDEANKTIENYSNMPENRQIAIKNVVKNFFLSNEDQVDGG